MTERRFPREFSDVTVTFDDGSTTTYRINAGIGINTYLAREAGASGVLAIHNEGEAWGIPLSSIKGWTIKPVATDAEETRTQDDDHA